MFPTSDDPTPTPDFPADADAYLLMRGEIRTPNKTLFQGDPLTEEYARTNWNTDGFGQILPVDVSKSTDGLPVVTPYTPPEGWTTSASELRENASDAVSIDQSANQPQRVLDTTTVYELELRDEVPPLEDSNA